MRSLRLTAVLCIVAITSLCIWSSQCDGVRAVDPAQASVITSPVEAHLTDSTTVVYPNGVRGAGQSLGDTRTRYDLKFSRLDNVDSIPLAYVVGMEPFSNETNVGRHIVVSTRATRDVGVV